MASSNIDQPWMFRSIGGGGGGGDSWYPTCDAFARETESALTKALQQSFFNNPQHYSENISVLNQPVMVEQQKKQKSNDYYYYNNNNNNTASASASTITVSGSGSKPETPGSRPTKGNNNNNNLGVMNGKTTKRKSRASKRSMTTFIQADPANFRQMVQQVTGVKFEGNGMNNGQFPSVIKPETLRQPYISNKLQGLLPTLDTSAYLLDHHNSNNYRGSSSSGLGLAEDGGVGNDFYAFSCFPTLESSI